MGKQRVVFELRRISEGNWEIEARHPDPGVEIRLITGLATKEECHEWLNGNRKIAWLRSEGYAK